MHAIIKIDTRIYRDFIAQSIGVAHSVCLWDLTLGMVWESWEALYAYMNRLREFNAPDIPMSVDYLERVVIPLAEYVLDWCGVEEYELITAMDFEDWKTNLAGLKALAARARNGMDCS